MREVRWGQQSERELRVHISEVQGRAFQSWEEEEEKGKKEEEKDEEEKEEEEKEEGEEEEE